MEYPREFSAEARAEIEAERLTGINWLARKRKQVESYFPGPVEADEQNLRTYILRVFLAFVKQACKLDSTAWSVDRIRREAEEFLRIFTIEAYYEQGYNRNGHRLSEMISNWTGNILPEVEREFRQSAEWRKYERQLLRAAKAPTHATRPTSPSNDITITTNRRAAVDAYIDEVHRKQGRRITRTDSWKEARYKSRTEFERWERNDSKNPNRTAHERFTRILTEKPHLK
jgi:hypothetical protein